MVSSVSENTISVPWTETHNNTGNTHFLMIDKKHLWLFALFVQLFSSYLKFTDLCFVSLPLEMVLPVSEDTIF